MSEYGRPLRLTSPLTRGQPVKDAQWLLAGHSRFPDLATYKDGTIDGVYGPVTAHAAARAKYWLGYPQPSCDPTFGQTLYEYLRTERWRPLPHPYQLRRQERLAAVTPGSRALTEAMGHLGYIEGPGRNENIFGAWYHMNFEPWCAIFASYCHVVSGAAPSFRYSYVPKIYDDAAAGRNGLHLVSTPRIGDLALFDWPGERLAHVAFVRDVPLGDSFLDLGGNTGTVNMPNGGEVASNLRHIELVHSWVRVS